MSLLNIGVKMRYFDCDNLYLNMLNQPHLLVAGTTGSGKSTLLNTLMFNCLAFCPQQAQFILIDPKGCELVDYARLPHTLKHCTSLNEILSALELACNLMDSRFKEMKKKNQKESEHIHTYVIIDEYIDIKLQLGKKAEQLLIRLIAKGRASRIHVILCTQRPTRDIINGAIVANFPAKIALRCNSKQESRNIIDIGGAELLPRYGQALYRLPECRDIQTIEIKQTPHEQIIERVDYWINNPDWKKWRGIKVKKQIKLNKSIIGLLIFGIILLLIMIAI